MGHSWQKLNPLGIEIRILFENNMNTMATDALTPLSNGDFENNFND